MAYLYIGLSASCSVLIAHLLKITEVRKLRTLNTLTANYLSAFIIAFILGVQRSEGWPGAPSSILILFCMIVGAFFIANFFLYSKSVHANGMGITIAFMRLSVLVPILISIYLYNEHLGWLETLGVILVFSSMIMLVPKKSTVKLGAINAVWLLLFIFLIAGFADASLKVYEEEFSVQINELLFMSLVFGCAFLIGIAACLMQRDSLFTKDEFKLGAFLGLPNLYSAIFLIWALGSVDGSIAYPVVNILIVLGGTLAGLWYWKDRVTGWQWAGLLLAVIAILILL